jgi:hypothetical protein
MVNLGFLHVSIKIKQHATGIVFIRVVGNGYGVKTNKNHPMDGLVVAFIYR